MHNAREIQLIRYGKFQDPSVEKERDLSLMEIYRTIIACQIMALVGVGALIAWIG